MGDQETSQMAAGRLPMLAEQYGTTTDHDTLAYLAEQLVDVQSDLLDDEGAWEFADVASDYANAVDDILREYEHELAGEEAQEALAEAKQACIDGYWAAEYHPADGEDDEDDDDLEDVLD